MPRGLTLVMGLILAGCASLPRDLPPRPAMLHPQADRTLATLAREVRTAPMSGDGAPWWQAFRRPSLSRLEDEALKGNPDLTTARARLEAAARAEALARLNAGVHYSTDATMVRERFSENGIFPPPIGGSTYTQTDLTQSFTYAPDLWGRNRALVEAAHAGTQGARAAAEATRLTLSAAVADAYFAWADSNAELALAQAIEARHQREYELTDTRFALGLDSIAPVHEARQKLDLDKDRVQGLIYLDRTWRYRLAALIGLDPDHAAGLPEPSLEGLVPQLPASLPLDALAHRPDVAAQRADLEAAQAQSAATRAEFYPNIDLNAAIGLETLDLETLLNRSSLMFTVGPALHLPLFNTRTLQARLGIREADISAAVGVYNHTILEAARQVADRYAVNASLDQREASQQQALNEAEQVRALVDRRLELGLVRPLDALQADSAVLEQQLNATQLLASQLRARVALAEALGGVTQPSKE
ncbi:MAG: efflux transporter outer membrane subunit [Thiobacillaceae bacterium]